MTRPRYLHFELPLRILNFLVDFSPFIKRSSINPLSSPLQADVFSLGATLYLTLSGYHCFEDPSNPRDITNMLKNQIRGLCRPLPHHLSRSTVAFLLQRMLVPDPRKRATLEEVCNHPWTQEGLRKMQQNALLVAQWPMGSSPSTAASPNAAVRPQQVPVPVPVSPGAAFGSADAQSPYPLAQQYYDFQ